MNLMIYGAGGLGHEVLDLALDLERGGQRRYREILFLDDHPSVKDYMGYPVYRPQEAYARYGREDTGVVIAAGEPAVRQRLIGRVREAGYGFETLVHPSAHTGLNAGYGPGTVIQRGVFLSCDCVTGSNCFLQPGAMAGHNCRIGDNCVISSNAVLSGGVSVGDNTYLAVGISVREGIHIGRDTVVGMGAVVVRDIPENVIALGNPARPVKHKDDARVFGS